jgi:nucleotide-binding universal stress UspA family protein
MKKIIAAIDGLKYANNIQQYAIETARLNDAFLTGVFLDDFTYNSYKIYDLITKEGVSEKDIRQYSVRDRETRQQTVLAFEEACRQTGIPYNVHHDKNIALQELLHESIFADLLIISNSETFSHHEEQAPTRFIRDMLPDVQCPVLLVPKEYKPVEKLVFLYDGDPSSVYAIKMFTYLFPALKNLPAEIVAVKGHYEDLHLPDNHLMKEFIKRHFPEATFTVLRGEASLEIIQHLKKQSHEQLLLVLGAYNRGSLSRWLKHSMADALMRELQVPLFIAHHT